MARCSGTKPDGSPCVRIVGSKQQFCFAHDPSKAAARKKIAAKGGRARGSQELANVRSEIKTAIDDVLTGDLDPKRAAVALQGFNVLLRCIEAERGSRLEEIERELHLLEDQIAGRG